MAPKVWPGNSNLRGRLSTVDLLVQANIDQLLLTLKQYLLYYKTSYLNEEVSCTEPSPSLSVPWFGWFVNLLIIFGRTLVVQIPHPYLYLNGWPEHPILGVGNL